MLTGDLITVREISSEQKLFDLLHALAFPGQPMVFRGQPNAQMRLRPSIERVVGWAETTLPAKEKYALGEFKRRAHHYLLDLPSMDDELEWLALMRHHGAPSRLLDWTRSPYVAAFFAALDAINKDFAIWAIDQEKLKEHALSELRKAEAKELLRERNPEFKDEDLDSWERFLGSSSNFRVAFLTPERRSAGARPFPRFVAPLEPHRMNERLTIQQGLFICANWPAIPFETTLGGMLRAAGAGKQWLHKLEIKAEARFEVLAQLHSMNITEATLFPGLDGFARSLRVSAEIVGRAWFDAGSVLS